MISTYKKGFTIIELMVVVAIISILTAIVLANLTGAKQRSRDAKRISDIAQIQLALELFFDRCNQYPPATNSSPTLTAGNGSYGCPSGITLGSFISKIPVGPNANENYNYVTNGSYTDYVISSNLETKAAALNDDIDGTVTFGIGVTVVCDDGQYNIYCVQPR